MRSPKVRLSHNSIPTSIAALAPSWRNIIFSVMCAAFLWVTISITMIHQQSKVSGRPHGLLVGLVGGVMVRVALVLLIHWWRAFLWHQHSTRTKVVRLVNSSLTFLTMTTTDRVVISTAPAAHHRQSECCGRVDFWHIKKVCSKRFDWNKLLGTCSKIVFLAWAWGLKKFLLLVVGRMMN